MDNSNNFEQVFKERSEADRALFDKDKSLYTKNRAATIMGRFKTDKAFAVSIIANVEASIDTLEEAIKTRNIVTVSELLTYIRGQQWKALQTLIVGEELLTWEDVVTRFYQQSNKKD